MKRQLTAIGMAMALSGLTACGGGGGAATATGPTLGAGFFLDAPVSGLTYTSGGQTGTTGLDGSFKYEVGKPVTFKLGGVVIGTATPTSQGTAVITPVNLVAGAAGSTNATVQQIGVFLQTLDSDQNPANGIQLSAATVQAATGQVVDFTNSASVAAVLNAVAPGVVPVTPAQATANMQQSFRAAAAGFYTGTYTGSCGIGQNAGGTWSLTVDSAGNVSGTGVSTVVPGTSGTVTGTRQPNGVYSGTSSGSNGTASWSGTIAANGIVTINWTGTGPSAGCSGTASGSKATNNVKSFAGSYSGSYSGTDNGTWTITVSPTGAISGTGNSAMVGAFTVSGNVSANGSVTMTQAQGGASTGAVFSGTYNAFGGVSGTWSNAGASGSFSGFRN